MRELTSAEKVRLTGGADMWRTHGIPDAGIPPTLLSDGPHGLRTQPPGDNQAAFGTSVPATCFPPAVALAATWSRSLAEEVGSALGREARAADVGVLLGPGINIKRSPLCGRNFEYFSEDPHVTGALASAYVRGVQAHGVATTPKHFAANNQETDRMRRSSQVDLRTLREIYLRAFETVVREADPWAIMCSYNRINGVLASENHWLLTDVLRREWGFPGAVVSDWSAVSDRVAALRAGVDLEMPAHAYHERDAAAALADGSLDPSVVDAASARVAALLRRVGANGPAASVDREAHHRLARVVAEQAVVLLDNDGILPLPAQAQVAVIGEFARTPRYQGAGSSLVNATRVDNALDRIAEITSGTAQFEQGFAIGDAPADASTADRAVALARRSEIVLLFLGLGEREESEGYDRTTLDLPADQLGLLDGILAVNSNVVVVLSNGSSVLVPFAGRVRAVVEGWLLGQAGGPALADVLFGAVNPSGKLTETIPRRLEDVPSFLHFPGDASGVHYGEGLFVGYRGYDAVGTDVAYPFGHGLSYSSFAYSDLAVTVGADGLSVEVTVTNVGDRAGREIVQVYAAKPDSAVARVPRELVAFGETTLEAGAGERLTLPVPRERLAYWSVCDDAWIVESGAYVLSVGASSRDLPLVTSVEIAGTQTRRPVTVHSTVEEALARPGLVRPVRDLLRAAFGDLAGTSLDDIDRVLLGFPLHVVVGAARVDPAQVQSVLDRANADADDDASSS